MRATIDIFLSGAQYRKCLKGALAPIQRRYRLMRLEIEILFYLMDATEANNRLRDIVRLEGFNKGQVSRAVSRLEEMGIVSRRLDAQDSRVQHIDILPGNEALLRDVAQAYRGVNDMIYRNISDEEIAAFRATAGRIADNMAAALVDERLAATQAEDDPQ